MDTQQAQVARPPTSTTMNLVQARTRDRPSPMTMYVCMYVSSGIAQRAKEQQAQHLERVQQLLQPCPSMDAVCLFALSTAVHSPTSPFRKLSNVVSNAMPFHVKGVASYAACGHVACQQRLVGDMYGHDLLSFVRGSTHARGDQNIGIGGGLSRHYERRVLLYPREAPVLTTGHLSASLIRWCAVRCMHRGASDYIGAGRGLSSCLCIDNTSSKNRQPFQRRMRAPNRVALAAMPQVSLLGSWTE